MKTVAFLTNRDNISVGSHRIWVIDLSTYLSDVGIQTTITNNPRTASEYDIVICGKSDVKLACDFKKSNPNTYVGIINLAADRTNLPIDFVIVGSLEEMDSLSSYKHVLLFPLIESMYSVDKPKIHRKKDLIQICFHGSFTHLSKFQPSLKQALEELDKEINFELLIITNDTDFKWEVGKPNIKNITIKTWNLNTIKEDILGCDIGIVPNITTYSSKDQESNPELGLYDTDYILRLKNKSNAGRAFVFHQLGIPVVADFTPSNFHIMGGNDCGYLVSSANGWKQSILKLTNTRNRQEISNKAFEKFRSLYDTKHWANKLYTELIEITHG